MKRNLNPIQPLIYPLDRKKQLSGVGNKAANLQRLAQLGMPVPQTFVLPWDAYLRYTANDLSVVDQILAELSEKLDPGKCYAVRSSANIEDSFEHSFAGQFKTVLNVQGAQALLQAIWAVWATAKTPEVSAYLQKHSLDVSILRMGVILQEMVSPVFSGVAFSRNPLTGLRETVVEAVEGPGTALVQEGATPFRWTFRGGQFTRRPDAEIVPLALVEEIVRGTHQIARKMKQDVDLEWVYDGKSLYWVQMRKITTLRDVKVYSDSISREMIAGIIKPLIWSINIPLICGVWIRMLTELIGPNDLTPDQLVRQFYYRAYFNMGLLGEIFEQLGFPAESLEIMWGLASEEQSLNTAGSSKMKMPKGMPMGKHMLRLLPRAIRFLSKRWNLSTLLEKRLPELEASYRAIAADVVEDLSPTDLMDGIDRLYRLNEEAAYYNIIAPISMYAFSTMLRKQLKQFGYDFARLDLHQNSSEFLRFSPTHQLESLSRRFQALPHEYQEQVRQGNYVDVQTNPHLDGFRSGLVDLMRDFGHLCDNGNDFSSRPWRENGDTILRLVVEFIPASTVGDAKIPFDALRLPFFKRWLVRWLYERSRRFLLFREHISYVYTLGYGLFRLYFLALAGHFVRHGLMEAREDIFYLTIDQIRALAANLPMEEADIMRLREGISQRRREVEAAQGVTLPSVIFGDQIPPAPQAFERVLRGTPTSRGYCTGCVKIVSGLGDFQKVQTGDVLVIPFSEVGWTPLFSRAAGVIAESGGMLSHSSIVAREYGIPAVVSVSGAMNLTDGVCVTIDGYKGEILIHEDPDQGLDVQIDRQPSKTKD